MCLILGSHHHYSCVILCFIICDQYLYHVPWHYASVSCMLLVSILLNYSGSLDVMLPWMLVNYLRYFLLLCLSLTICHLNLAPELIEKSGDNMLFRLRNLYSQAKDLSETEVRYELTIWICRCYLVLVLLCILLMHKWNTLLSSNDACWTSFYKILLWECIILF